MSDERKPSILDTGNEAILEAVKKEKPAKFTIGGSFNGRQASGGLTVDRKLSNGWGATAYAKAYWNQKPVVPTDKFGFVIGGEISKEFGPHQLLYTEPDRSLLTYVKAYWNDQAVT